MHDIAPDDIIDSLAAANLLALFLRLLQQRVIVKNLSIIPISAPTRRTPRS